VGLGTAGKWMAFRVLIRLHRKLGRHFFPGVASEERVALAGVLSGVIVF
jgi:hypothetical protein